MIRTYMPIMGLCHVTWNRGWWVAVPDCSHMRGSGEDSAERRDS
jgi:hypothetical protein